MTLKKGLKALKEYVKSEEEFCNRTARDTIEQIKINEKRINAYILKNIVRDFEQQGIELPVTVFADVAGGGYEMIREAKENEPYFIAENIELQRRPTVLTASVSEQADNYAFIVGTLTGIAEGIILNYILKLIDTVAKRIRIGKKIIPINTDVEEIRKIIREELERSKKEQSDNSEEDV
jgi:hypothetical protein